MKKNNNAAQIIKNIINKGAMMNATEEQTLVNTAKHGNVETRIAARNALYTAYEGEIKKAHATSARGLNPNKFGRGYNKKGYEYEADSGRIFEVFTAALDKYDPSLVDMTKIKNTNPFLSYMKYELNHRAMDEVRKDTTYYDRVSLFSELSNRLSKGEDDGDEILEAAFNRDEIYDADAVEFAEEEKRQAVRQLISVTDEGSVERETLENFLEALGYEKKVIPAIAKKMKLSKPTVYKYIDRALEKLPKRMAQDFRDLLAA